MEIMSVPLKPGDIKPGEVGLQESDLLERMPDGEGVCDMEMEAVRLISLGCFCGPKLSFKKLGRGAETLPFDWTRTRLSGIFHHLRNDFRDYFDWSTMQILPETGMTIFRGYYHSFWHDNPTDPAMQERYTRRFKRFKEIDARSAPVLFVRAVAVSDELAQGPELLALLKELYGPRACLLLIVDFQTTAKGAAMVGGHPDLLVYYLEPDVHDADRADGAPYTEPVRVALNWILGRAVPAMQFVDMATIIKCVDKTDWGLKGLSDVAAFEEEQDMTPSSASNALPKAAIGSDLLEQAAAFASADDGISCLPLGGEFGCATKRTLQRMCRSSQALPFDWVRATVDGLLHFLEKDFQGFFDYTVRKRALAASRQALGPGAAPSRWSMTRSCRHAFWHDDPDAPEMRESYRRRMQNWQAAAFSGRPLLFLRPVLDRDELLRAGELFSLLQRKYGKQVCLVLIVDFQPKTIGTLMVEEYEDMLVYFLGKEDRDPEAPYSRAVQAGLSWMSGAPFEAGCVDNLKQLHACAADPICSSDREKNLDCLERFEHLEALELLPVVATAVVSNPVNGKASSGGYAAN
eukprot:TRINITY_DN41980_c0_g1_i1.p1 TRINITY_DN41980_c0_g1~~TRINITY_DN41980_c0_g1_i1.p1  ORF type:complete len:576 (+),score=143.68 TRINITY_DN41980_c0_g1_i1:170-1897(+)